MRKTGNLIFLISLLVLFSLNMLMISSVGPQLLIKQAAAWGIGVFLFFIGRQIDPKNIGSAKTFIFIASCILLVLPIFMNNFVRGSRRWIDIGPLSIQPSEVAKPWILLSLVNSKNIFLIFIPTLIVLLQPDLGSAISVFFLVAPMAMYHPKIIKYLIIAATLFIVSSPIIWKYALHDYQKHRIINFINPNSDPLGRGYNVIQSKIAIGSGGLIGKGYKSGSQGQLFFLPEKHTDFMFAATVEERGALGAFILFAAYFGLIGSLISRAFSITNNRPLFLFTLAIAIQIWVQMFINVGMNLGILPVTGIPLPFLSVGGSSIMSFLFSFGIIFSSL